MEHSATSVRNVVRELLQAKSDTAHFGDDDSLVFSGRLESVDVLEIVVFLEERYGIDFSTLGFDQSNFDSVNQIVQLIDAMNGEGQNQR